MSNLEISFVSAEPKGLQLKGCDNGDVVFVSTDLNDPFIVTSKVEKGMILCVILGTGEVVHLAQSRLVYPASSVEVRITR